MSALHRRSSSIGLLFGLVCAGIAVMPAPAAQIGAEEYTAFAVSPGGIRNRPVADIVNISIERWTTEAQSRQLASALEEGGPDELLDRLQDLPEIGRIRTPDSIGYALRYAAQQPLPEGGRRIVLVTDRPIRFWETWFASRTLDYPFTVIELRVDQNGEGEGKLSIASRVIPQRGGLVLEDWATTPVQLNEVRRDD